MNHQIKKVVLLEPSVSSLNLGDQVIVESIKREMDYLLQDAFVVEQSTQSPVMHFYQIFNERFRAPADADYKFVCGSNLFWDNMLHPYPQWNINHLTCTNSRNSIMVGVGSCSTYPKLNYYTKSLYNRVLSRDYYHSVRDEATKARLESLGFKAINTGCPTTWSLTPEHCSNIPTKKADKVVFTVNEYHKIPETDKALVSVLARNYEQVCFWPQGYTDMEYINSLELGVPLKILRPNLDDMRNTLRENRMDYVGTRLHGGIFAMQNFTRSIILMVDNRARDMRESFSIPTVERDNMGQLEEMIRSDWSTSINVNRDAIRFWKEQFK